MLAALVAPDRFMPRIVAAERAMAAVLVITICAGIAAFAIGSRIDMTRTVLDDELKTLRENPGSDPMSDRDLTEQIAKQRSIEQVKLGLAAGVLTPLELGALALALYLVGRYVGGKPTIKRSMAAAAHGMLPMALKSLMVAWLAWPRESLSSMDVDKLRSVSHLVVADIPGPLGRLLSVDIFALWSVVLLGFGLAAAAGLTRRRAFITLFSCFALFQLLTGGGPTPPPPGPGAGVNR